MVTASAISAVSPAPVSLSISARTARPISEAISRISDFAHALCGHRRSAHPDAGPNHGLLRIERDGVLVQRDPRGVASDLSISTGYLRRRADRSAPGACRCRPTPAHPLFGEPGDQRLGILDDLACVLLVLRLRASLSATALAATTCIRGPPCRKGNTALSIFAGEFFLAQDHAAARPAKDFVRRERDYVGVRNRRRDGLARDQADEVRGVHHELGANLVGDLAEGLRNR